jgi:cytochrome c-type biogenesis protein CcmF
MFIGALIMLLSAVQMTFTTSIPVWNKVFGLKLAPPADVIGHYNNIQVWIALLAAMGAGLVLFFSYKANRISSFVKWSLASAVLAIVLAFAIAYGMDIHITGVFGAEAKIPFVSPFFLLLLFSLYTIFSSLSYMLIVLKGRWSTSGGSVAHLGFGVFLVGVLLSQYKMQVVSLNEAGINFGKEFEGKEQLENILLVKDSTYNMAGYEITYTGRRAEKNDQIYTVDYVRKQGDKITEKFTLSPYVVTNKKNGKFIKPKYQTLFDKRYFHPHSSSSRL